MDALRSTGHMIQRTGSALAHAATATARGAGNVIATTADLGSRVIDHFTIPRNRILATVSSAIGGGTSYALSSWSSTIMARSMINTVVSAGARWGIPAGLCRIGAMGYIAAVGVPNLPSWVVAGGGFAATFAVIGIGNTILNYISSGQREQAQEGIDKLRRVAQTATEKETEANAKATKAKERFSTSYLVVNEQIARAKARKKAAAQEVDPAKKARLENEATELLAAADQIMRGAGKDQQEYVQLTDEAKEAREVAAAARFALAQAAEALQPAATANEKEPTTEKEELAKVYAEKVGTFFDQLAKKREDDLPLATPTQFLTTVAA